MKVPHSNWSYFLEVLRPLPKNTGKSRNSCTVRGRGVGAEGMVKKWTNPYCPGTNTKRSQIVCAVIFISLTSENRRTRLLGLPAQSLRFPRYEGRTIGFEVNAKIQKQVFGTPHSWKEILLHVPLSFDSDINKRCDLLYTKIIFRSGRKSYALVQHLFPVQKNLVFHTFHGWCSYNFRQAGSNVPGTDFWALKSRSGNSRFPGREIRILGSEKFLVQSV